MRDLGSRDIIGMSATSADRVRAVLLTLRSEC